MEAIPITINGAKSLELELLRLKDEERPRKLVILQQRESMGILKKMLNIMLQKKSRVLLKVEFRRLNQNYLAYKLLMLDNLTKTVAVFLEQQSTF